MEDYVVADDIFSEPDVIDDEGPSDDLLGYSVDRMLRAYVPKRRATFFKNLKTMQGMLDDDVTDLSVTIRESLKALHGSQTRPD